MIDKLIENLAEQYPDSNHKMTVEDFASWLSKNSAPVVERQAVFMKPQYLTVQGLWIECAADDAKAVKFYTSPPAPVAADIAHDRAYRNGMMAGFNFGISGNEKGYALAIANFNSEIHAAKGEHPAPVAVMLPDRKPHGRGIAPMQNARNSAWNACLDKVKELNQ